MSDNSRIESDNLSQWRGYVVRAIEDICKDVEEEKRKNLDQDRDIIDLKGKVSELLVKAGFWGVVGGIGGVLVTIAVALLIHFITVSKGVRIPTP